MSDTFDNLRAILKGEQWWESMRLLTKGRIIWI
jgi:hypothetical protein